MADGNLQLALRIKADLDQAIGQLKDLRSSIDEVSKTTAASAKQSNVHAAAIQKQADAADQAAGKTGELAEATQQQSDHAAAAAANTEKLNRLLTEEAAAAEAAAGAVQEVSAAELLNADRTQHARESNAAFAAAELAEKERLKTATVDAAAAELLYAKIDPAAGKLARLDVLEAELNSLHGKGLVAAEDFTHLGGVLQAQRDKLGGVTTALVAVGDAEVGVALNARAMREATTILSEAASGNFGRIRQSGFALANQTGILEGVFTATGGAILGVVAILGGYVAGVAAGEAQQQALNKVLIATGGIAGVTSGQLGAMRDQIGASTGEFGEAQKALIALADGGKVSGDSLGKLAESAVTLAQLTGQSVESIVQQIEKIGDAPSKTLVELNDKYHFLTVSTYEQIKALEDQGRSQDAVKLGVDALKEATDADARQMEASTGLLVRGWNAVGKEIASVIQGVKNLGRSDADYALLRAKENLAAVSSPSALARGLTNPLEVEQAQAEVAAAQRLVDQAHAAAAVRGEYDKQTQAILRATQAAADLTKEEAKRLALMGKVTEVQKVQYEIDHGALHDAIPSAQRAALAVAAAEDAKQKAIDAASKRSRSKGDGGVDKAELSADVQATRTALAALDDAYRNSDHVLDAQHKAGLISDAEYYQGKLKNINDLETGEVAALEKEKANVATHGKTAADRIRIDQQVASIDAQITKAHADAATQRAEIEAAQIEATNKAQEAWTRFRDSLGTPAEVKADKAIAQIQQLNDFLAKGTINADEYHDALEKIAAASIDLPKYRDPTASAHSFGSDLSDNFKAQADLDTAYQQQSDANEAFRAKDLANEAAYLAKKAALDKQYAQQSAAIEHARGQLTLSTAAGIFGQLATLSSSHNKRIATIGKAAAIAQAIINTYQSATESYASLASIPYIGPALGFAAAAAAVAAGLANVAQIRAQPIGGYSEGGYTGPGGKHQPAGIVHAGEVVWSQDDVARAGGVLSVESMRLRGYADGGFVHPLANVPPPPDFDAGRARFIAPVNSSAQAAAPAPAPHIKIVNAFNHDDVAQAIASTSIFERAVLNTITNNPRSIRAALS